MKQVASLLFSLWVMLLLAAFPRVNYAQAPEKFSYQAVIRDNLNQLVLNQTIGFQISILQGSATGTPVYVETQTPLSNANGLISLEVGTGIVVSGDFTSIDWSAGPYFIKTEADPSGGTGYTITGVSQLISVPYALHAKTAQEVTGPITETDPVFSASPASGITTSNITNWNSAFGWGDHTGLYRPVSWNPSWLDVTGKPTTVSGYGITDAMTTSHAASSITGTNLINWSTAFGWGNHATAGYLTSFTETDPAFSASPAGGITSSNISNWNTVYGWGNHATAGYMTSFTETDPAFSASPAGGITASNISNWNTVYGWGNHSTAGYMTSFTETDPAFSASPAGGITAGNISNWNTVYGWGNHATAGYLTSFTETDPAFSASPAGGITAGNISNWNTVYGWGNHATAGYITGNQNITLSGDLTGSGTTAITTILSDNAVTAVKIANNAVTNAKIANSAVTASKIAQEGATAGQVLKWNGTTWAPSDDLQGTGGSNPTGPAGGDLTGTYPNPSIANNAVTVTKIANNAITVAKLPAGATATTFLRGDGLWVTPPTGITTETDPIFSLSPAASITAGNISNWNTVYGWGNHATAGYLTSFTETDPTWSGSANTIYDIGRMGNVGIGTMSPATQLHTTGSVRFAGAGTPGAGKVLTSDVDGNATWETPTGGGVMPSGNSSNTLRHNGTNWVANDLLRNDGAGLGIGTNPVANTQLRLARPNGNFGAGYTNIYASRAGDPVAANGGTSWSRSGVDAAIKGFSDYGNNFSAAVAGYGYLDYANSAALIGSNFAGTTYGGLAFKDANSVLWAGYFKGNINVTGSMFIETGNIGVGTNNPDARMEIAGTGVQGLRLKSISTTIPGEVYIDFMREGNNYYDWRIRNTGGDLRFSWSDDDLTTVNDLMTLRHTLGRVGIGTTSPLAQLHTTGTVRLAGAGTPGEGKVLTSDANGNATWEPLRYQVGDFAHGGIVFHVEPCGTKGLVCAKYDQCYDYTNSTSWSAGTNGNTQAKGDGLYAGKANTSIIIAAHVAIGDNGNLYAARICNELQITEGGITYGDWYLPSKAELNLMYLNKVIINATALANSGTAFGQLVLQYWSSTENSSNSAWWQRCDTGQQSTYSKYQSYGNYGLVRAVRAF